MAITPDAKMYDYQTGVATKLVPMSDGQGTYAPAVVAFQPLSPADKLGGASGTIVTTLTMTYDGSGNLLTVTRS
jgi:hypothetical protein